MTGRGRLWIRLPRSALAAFFFFAFGLGGLVLGVLLFPLLLLLGTGQRSGRARRALVRFCYRLFVGAARVTGLFRVAVTPEDRKKLASLRGCVVVANHTTLIDVVILLACLPDATAVAKAAAGRNFFYSRVVNGAFIVNDDPAGVLDAANRLLSEGVNILIFPEGTRTPPDSPHRKLHRGAAQIALHAGAPVRCVRITSDPQVLAKGQPWWDVADRVITFSLFDVGELPVPANVSGVVPHAAAVALTDRIGEKLMILARRSVASRQT